MPKFYYSEKIDSFLKESSDSILGKLLTQDSFETKENQKYAWKEEIRILKQQLTFFSEGRIIFEYTIPRIGSRIDTVCIINNLLFIIEFKVGQKDYISDAKNQVMDYCLDLKYFHEESKDLTIIPILISTEANERKNIYELFHDKISYINCCNGTELNECIKTCISTFAGNSKEIDYEKWILSKYSPTPTIIEAAQTLYRTHSVKSIKNNDAENLNVTTEEVNTIIDDCKKNKKKAICFITGVPGAGKTLAGLEIANNRHNFAEDEHAVFLSGNDPLVEVLQAALARDKSKRTGVSIKEAERETKSFIQIVHKFRDTCIDDERPPIEKVAIFDEAQRSWDEPNLSDFMKKKKGIPNFNMSEPEFLISVMNRHEDWAVIICLVGGGQEIYKGEAGIATWFEAMKHYPDWVVYISDRLSDEEYVGKQSLNKLISNKQLIINNNLHLAVDLRSFRAENLSKFVKALIDNDKDTAQFLYTELNKTYPLCMTRNLSVAKQWVITNARGNERYGLIASSEGKRLRAEGIWVPSTINNVAWFLYGKDNVDSSFYLEVPASEFKIQGLEIDYAILAWDADFRYVNGNFDYYQFRTSWQHKHDEMKKRYLKNAYRVLLTRARQGLIIYIPEGNDNDPTTHSSLYNGTYEYFKSIGIKEI